ncbi:MAG: phosphatidylcholine/phosphatidylserine synthase [Alphaproteobacteria bacterium]|nr:phosphatidylcholine/phosphatidylserine synthase [Alphaproteobacteria bacterium]
MTDAIKPIFPNAVTMMALAFGVSSINMALWGRWELAVLFIVLAGFFDFMDGRVARALDVSSHFGAELDSLSDFVSFGVAPGFLMYNWTMDTTMRAEALKDITYRTDAVGLYWGVVLFFAVCCATRLARFNTMLNERQPKYWTHFFMGVPAPAGGGLAMLPLIMWMATGGQVALFRAPWFVSCFVIFAGVMMASRIPTLCLKHLHPNRSMRSILMFVMLALICGFATLPWQTLSVVGVGYLISIPIGIFYFLHFKKNCG